MAISLPGCESQTGLCLFNPGPVMAAGSPLLHLPLKLQSHVMERVRRRGHLETWVLVLAVPPTHWVILNESSPICSMKRLNQTSDPQGFQLYEPHSLVYVPHIQKIINLWLSRTSAIILNLPICFRGQFFQP